MARHLCIHGHLAPALPSPVDADADADARTRRIVTGAMDAIVSAAVDDDGTISVDDGDHHG